VQSYDTNQPDIVLIFTLVNVKKCNALTSRQLSDRHPLTVKILEGKC